MKHLKKPWVEVLALFLVMLFTIAVMVNEGGVAW
jgi:hypothetical protein